ncbi:MAG: prolipoprotein diacylglyceryl transferase [Pseudomonadota bacterium]
MHPILFRIGGLTVHTYGLFVAIGFLMGMALAVRESRRLGIDPEKTANLFFWIVISAIAGSRLLYIIVEFRSFVSAPLETVKIWKGGLVFYGGLILAVIVAVFYIRRNGMPLWRTMDILVPSLAIGQVFGRTGCFFAGCCYGRPANGRFAVTFTNPDSLAPLYIPLHPVQLYEAAAVFVIFLVLWTVRRAKRFEGRLVWIYLTLYSGARFLIENYRGDPRGRVLGNVFSTGQFISLVLILAGVLGYIYSQRRRPE